MREKYIDNTLTLVVALMGTEAAVFWTAAGVGLGLGLGLRVEGRRLAGTKMGLA